MSKYNGMKQFIFDVDGTLVESSENIDPSFGKFLHKFFLENECYIVTGAAYQTTLRQLGHEICMAAQYMINSGGGHVLRQGKEVFASKFQLKPFHRKYLRNFLEGSDFPFKTGDHFDERIGMCNFSILGKNYTAKQRKQYIAWDMVTNERKNICSKFNKKMDGKAIARVAGQTGIDISHHSVSKKNTLQYLDDTDTSVFFGDQTQKGGNDYPLAQNLDNVHQVTDWRDTFSLLQEYSQSEPYNSLQRLGSL